MEKFSLPSKLKAASSLRGPEGNTVELRPEEKCTSGFSFEHYLMTNN